MGSAPARWRFRVHQTHVIRRAALTTDAHAFALHIGTPESRRKELRGSKRPLPSRAAEDVRERPAQESKRDPDERRPSRKLKADGAASCAATALAGQAYGAAGGAPWPQGAEAGTIPAHGRHTTSHNHNNPHTQPAMRAPPWMVPLPVARPRGGLCTLGRPWRPTELTHDSPGLRRATCVTSRLTSTEFVQHLRHRCVGN